MKGRIPQIVIACMVFGVVVYAGYAGWSAYAQIHAQQLAAQAALEQINVNKAKLSEALSHLHGLTSRDITDGFWYSYTDAAGVEHMVYFDIAELAAQGLTDDQIKDLLARIASSSIYSSATTRALTDPELSPDLQFHNELYSFNPDGSYLRTEKTLDTLVASGTPTSDDLFKLSYMAELDGNYAERDALNVRNCTQFKARCAAGMSTASIEGKVVDMQGQPIQGAKVSLLSRPSVVPVLTDVHGIFTFTTPVNSMEKIRIGAVKRNYSDGSTSIVVVSKGPSQKFNAGTITLGTPIDIVTIDTIRETVTGEANKVSLNGAFTIKTANSTYQIPNGAIVHKEGKPYSGQVDVYLYEFERGNAPQSLVMLDTFDQVMGYAGNLMKSFGMPYIQFFSPDGEELHVLKSNPMVLTYKIADMDALRNNTAHLYGPLTDADMQLLVQASEGQPYRIDRQFLIDHGLLRFPAFWVYDHRAGIWENVGISVLTMDGTIRAPFYTINNLKK